MTSDGSAYARFRRALNTGNKTLVIAAARELPQVGLDDALRICLVLRDGDPEQYQRAAVSWLGRFALEHEASRSTRSGWQPTLDALPDRAAEATEALQRLCVAHGIG